MSFAQDYYSHELAGKRVLKERGLWPERGLVLECPEGGCCALLGSERTPAEEVEALGHRVLFYPKFHCELNFIERYWCQAKWFARENFGYDFEALKATVPES